LGKLKIIVVVVGAYAYSLNV